MRKYKIFLESNEARYFIESIKKIQKRAIWIIVNTKFEKSAKNSIVDDVDKFTTALK